MEYLFGTPFSGMRLKQLREFLRGQGLDYDENTTFTVDLLENGQLVATGSLHHNVLNGIAAGYVPYRDELVGKVVDVLKKKANEEGKQHLFLQTRPSNKVLLSELGFYPVAETIDTLLMENIRDGVKNFVQAMDCHPHPQEIGAVIKDSSSPFGKKHFQIVEEAACTCDLVYLLILSGEPGRKNAQEVLEQARRRVAHLKNVKVYPTEDYQISAATFPSYFRKGKRRTDGVNCELDLMIFSRCFAKPLGITYRFIPETASRMVMEEYYRKMEIILPAYGIRVIRVPSGVR